MTNKEKRSILLSMVLGDGCLHNTSNNNSGSLTVNHGINQSDYVTWKAKIIENVTNRQISLRNGHKGKSIQFSVTFKKFKAWRKFCYPNGKKSIERILPFIKHPEFALAIWLMDDGYVEPSFSKLATGEKVNYGARFRIFTCDQPIKDQEYIIEWFKKHLNVIPTIKYQNKNGTLYPFLKFSQNDSLFIWEKIRDVVLNIKSMQYKFRHIENIYQKKLLQRNPSK
jgi:hypothetical protein